MRRLLLGVLAAVALVTTAAALTPAQLVTLFGGGSIWTPNCGLGFALNFASNQFCFAGGAATPTPSAPGWTFSRSGSAFAMLNGASQTFASGAARIFSGSLFLEAANTNLIYPSQGTIAFSYANSATSAASAALGPDGTTAFFTTCTPVAYNSYCQKNATITANTSQYTSSIYVPVGSSQTVRHLAAAVGGTQVFCDFDPSTGLPAGTGGETCNIAAVAGANGQTAWWRSSVTFTNDSATTAYTEYYPDHVNGTAPVNLGGLQVNLGTTAGSYIPTVSAAVTRNAEALTLSVPVAGYYSTFVSDIYGSAWTGPQSLSSTYAVAARTGQYLISKVEAFWMDLYDVFAIANTTPGQSWTTTSGLTTKVCGAYTGAICPPSSVGGIIGNQAAVPIQTVAGQNTAVYFATQGPRKYRHVEATVTWPNGAQHSGTQTGALWSTNDPYLVLSLPHVTFNNTQMVLQTRAAGGAFVTLATVNYPNRIDGAPHVVRLDGWPDGRTVSGCMDSYCATVVNPAMNALFGAQFVYEIFAVAPTTLASLTSSGTTVTATCASACNVQNLDTVVISGATPAAYNGTFVATSAGLSATSFTYTALSAPGSPATGTLVMADQYQMVFNEVGASFAAAPTF